MREAGRRTRKVRGGKSRAEVGSRHKGRGIGSGEGMSHARVRGDRVAGTTNASTGKARQYVGMRMANGCVCRCVEGWGKGKGRNEGKGGGMVRLCMEKTYRLQNVAMAGR